MNTTGPHAPSPCTRAAKPSTYPPAWRPRRISAASAAKATTRRAIRGARLTGGGAAGLRRRPGAGGPRCARGTRRSRRGSGGTPASRRTGPGRARTPCAGRGRRTTPSRRCSTRRAPDAPPRARPPCARHRACAPRPGPRARAPAPGPSPCESACATSRRGADPITAPPPPRCPPPPTARAGAEIQEPDARPPARAEAPQVRRSHRPPRSGPRTAHRDRPRGARRLALRRRASRHRAHDRAHALPGDARPRPGGAQPPRRRAGRRARRRHRLRGRHAALRGLQPGRRGCARTAGRAVLPEHGAHRALRQGAARGDRRDPRSPGGPGQLRARARLGALLRRRPRASRVRLGVERPRDDAAGGAGLHRAPLRTRQHVPRAGGRRHARRHSARARTRLPARRARRALAAGPCAPARDRPRPAPAHRPRAGLPRATHRRAARAARRAGALAGGRDRGCRSRCAPLPGAPRGPPARRGRGGVAACARRADPDGGAARLMRRAGALVVLLAGGPLAVAADAPVPLGPCGPIARAYDALEVPTAQLHHLGGTPLARLGLLAFHQGQPAPVPFQVDERRGRKLALPGGPEPTADDKPGVLDADDLLVFMACDAGEQASGAELARALEEAGAGAVWRELRIEDPVDHARGFVYLVSAEHPPATGRRYVAYVPAGDLVESARYRIGLVNALPTYFVLATGATLGPNLIDGLRLRAEATLRADLAHWTLDEQHGRHQLIAWKAGPVRVVRRSRHQVVLGLGIHLTAGIAHTYFYPQHVYGPGSLKLPFSPGILFRDISAYGGGDGRDLRGSRYFAPGAPPDGFAVDGHMDERERAFASSGEWFVLAHGTDALLFVTRMSENLRRGVTLSLVYRDDAARPSPPEDSPGTVPLVGYRGRGIEKLPGGRYQFALHIYTLSGYRRGDERRLLAQLDAPLTR